MENAEKISDDMYLVEQPVRPGWFCSVTVILGRSEVALVDTGYEDTPEQHVFPFLAKMGREPGELTRVVNTHRDGDHVLGNRAVKARTPARIAIHALEFDAVEAVDETLEDGDQVPLGDRVFRVILTPGHRPGSICLYDETARLLLTGDSVCGDREDLMRMERETYIASLRRLSELEIETMVMAHPFQPAGKAVLDADAARRMLERSIALAGG